MRAPAVRRAAAALMLLAIALPAAAQRGGAYVPGAGEDWQHRTPAQEGMDSARLQAAADFHREHEAKPPRDLAQAHFQTFGREPLGDPVGPFKPRGEPPGIVLRPGHIA